MPELPEVETVRRGLLPAILGKRIVGVEVRRDGLRRPFQPGFAQKLRGRTVIALSRRGKFLVAGLDSGDSLIIHLGMSGSIRIAAPGVAPEPGAFHRPRNAERRHDHVSFTMSDGVGITYNDPRRFGMMELVPTAALAVSAPLKDLGVEPLGPVFSGGALEAALRGRAAPLKAALLDQSIVAGLGNIYVSEALWRAGLSPFRPAGSVDGAAAKLLRNSIRAVLADAIKAGGSTLRDHRRTDGSAGGYQARFDAYDREGAPCGRRGCGGVIARAVQSGRATYYCPTHQT